MFHPHKESSDQVRSLTFVAHGLCLKYGELVIFWGGCECHPGSILA